MAKKKQNDIKNQIFDTAEKLGEVVGITEKKVSAALNTATEIAEQGIVQMLRQSKKIVSSNDIREVHKNFKRGYNRIKKSSSRK